MRSQACPLQEPLGATSQLPRLRVVEPASANSIENRFRRALYVINKQITEFIRQPVFRHYLIKTRFRLLPSRIITLTAQSMIELS